jgi:predicted alpha/beta-hydrolase family hydrolase
LRRAAELLRSRTGAPRLVLGGHSYGGRQASMLAADDPDVADALLLLSYPLHPPRQPERLRVEHFPRLRTPSAFVHGTRDPFGSPAEVEAALAAVAGPWRLELLEGAGHELQPSRRGRSPQPGAAGLRAVAELLRNI